MLTQHFSLAFVTLGGNAAAVFDEWTRLNHMAIRDASLCALPLEEFYSRAFLHFQLNHFNILLLAALAHASAMDVVLAECGARRGCCLLSNERANSAKGECCFSWLATLGSRSGSRIHP